MRSLPSTKLVLETLEKWRTRAHLTNLTDLHESYERECADLGLKAAAYSTFCKVLQGKSSLDYDQLPAIFKCHDLDDFDLFIDLCQPATLADIVVKSERDEWDRTLKKPMDFQVDPDQMGANRTRLDLLIFDPFESIEWKSHSGHEFVYVLKGTIECTFADWSTNSPESDVPQKHFKLSQGAAVVFPSKLWHLFVNPTAEKVHLAVARPTHANRHDRNA